MNFTSEFLSLFVAPFATAVSVILVFLQLKQANKQAATEFEDSLVQQYREIIKNIPVEAMLRKGIPPEKYLDSLSDIYHYIDLCNEQTFLRMENKVQAHTWENWRSGIQSHLSKPAFKEAWDYIKQHSDGSFSELRKLEDSGFNADPIEWKSNSKKWRFRR